MFTQSRWSVSHHKDGSTVHLDEYGYRARLWCLALEAFEALDAVPSHWACSPREWEFKIPLGRARRDEDSFIENSLGGWHYERISQFMIWMMNHEEKHARRVVDLPIDDETFAKVWPEMAFLVEDDEDDDED